MNYKKNHEFNVSNIRCIIYFILKIKDDILQYLKEILQSIYIKLKDLAMY